MKKIQERKINPLPEGVKVSDLNRSMNNMPFTKKGSTGPHNQVIVNSPQFRINQHKGA